MIKEVIAKTKCRYVYLNRTSGLKLNSFKDRKLCLAAWKYGILWCTIKLCIILCIVHTLAIVVSVLLVIHIRVPKSDIDILHTVIFHIMHLATIILVIRISTGKLSEYYICIMWLQSFPYCIIHHNNIVFKKKEKEGGSIFTFSKKWDTCVVSKQHAYLADERARIALSL